MSAVQYYLLDGTQLASLLHSLKCHSATAHTTVSFVDGTRSGGHSALNHEGRFRVRLTAEQFMDLTVNNSYYPWLTASREVVAFTERVMSGKVVTCATDDSTFSHEVVASELR